MVTADAARVTVRVAVAEPDPVQLAVPPDEMVVAGCVAVTVTVPSIAVLAPEVRRKPAVPWGSVSKSVVAKPGPTKVKGAGGPFAVASSSASTLTGSSFVTTKALKSLAVPGPDAVNAMSNWVWSAVATTVPTTVGFVLPLTSTMRATL